MTMSRGRERGQEGGEGEEETDNHNLYVGSLHSWDRPRYHDIFAALACSSVSKHQTIIRSSSLAPRKKCHG